MLTSDTEMRNTLKSVLLVISAVLVVSFASSCYDPDEDSHSEETQPTDIEQVDPESNGPAVTRELEYKQFQDRINQLRSELAECEYHCNTCLDRRE